MGGSVAEDDIEIICITRSREVVMHLETPLLIRHQSFHSRGVAQMAVIPGGDLDPIHNQYVLLSPLCV